MADASPKLPNPLGLQLEVREPDSVEIALLDVFLTYLPGDSRKSASVAAASIHQILLGDINESSDCAAEAVNAHELETSYIGGFFHAFWDMYSLLGCQIDPKNEAMDRPVSLVGALKHMPSEVRFGRYGRVWQDLPQMLWFFTERWNRKSTILSIQLLI